MFTIHLPVVGAGNVADAHGHQRSSNDLSCLYIVISLKYTRLLYSHSHSLQLTEMLRAHNRTSSHFTRFFWYSTAAPVSPTLLKFSLVFQDSL